MVPILFNNFDHLLYWYDYEKWLYIYAHEKVPFVLFKICLLGVFSFLHDFVIAKKVISLLIFLPILVEKTPINLQLVLICVHFWSLSELFEVCGIAFDFSPA